MKYANPTANQSRDVAEFYERQIVACNTFEQLDILKDKALEDGRLTAINRAYVMGCCKAMLTMLRRTSGIREVASQINDNDTLVGVAIKKAFQYFENFKADE